MQWRPIRNDVGRMETPRGWKLWTREQSVPFMSGQIKCKETVVAMRADVRRMRAAAEDNDLHVFTSNKRTQQIICLNMPRLANGESNMSKDSHGWPCG